jgi:DNA excision repair protein ERCC-4
MNSTTPKSPLKAKALPTIIIDTREQQPYAFSDGVSTTVATLKKGDYSLLGYESVIAVERKSLPDFISTVIHQYDRFEKELAVLATYPQRCIVVESSIAEVLDPQAAWRRHSAASPNSILARAISITARFGIPIVWAGDRIHAREYVERWLAYCWARRGELLAPAEPAAGPEVVNG